MQEPVLIFDFGNVVSFFDYLRACDRFGSRLGLDATTFMNQLQERGFSTLLTSFESGRISAEVFANRVMEMGNLRLDYSEFVDGWEDIFWINQPVATLIERLKTHGYRLMLGSNTNILHATFYRRRFASTLDLFDRLILSYEVGHMKPSREFYQACIAAANMPAASCIFIDDIVENVEGAREVGLRAIHYIDTPNLVTELNHLGVQVLPA